MKITKKQLIKLIKENFISESDASEKAHQKGLKSVGFGYWKNKAGSVVAKTVKGELTKLKSNDKKNYSSSHKHTKDNTTHSTPWEVGDNPTATKIKNQLNKNLKKWDPDIQKILKNTNVRTLYTNVDKVEFSGEGEDENELKQFKIAAQNRNNLKKAAIEICKKDKEISNYLKEKNIDVEKFVNDEIGNSKKGKYWKFQYNI